MVYTCTVAFILFFLQYHYLAHSLRGLSDTPLIWDAYQLNYHQKCACNLADTEASLRNVGGVVRYAGVMNGDNMIKTSNSHLSLHGA